MVYGSNANDIVFTNALAQVLDSFVDTAGKSAEEIRADVDKRVAAYVSQFYTTLVLMGMNVSAAPSELGIGWHPLSEPHWDKKNNKGYQMGFYGMEGLLADALRGRSASADFGRHRTDLDVGGAGRLKKGFVKTGNRIQHKKGTTYRSESGRLAGGQFAGVAQAYSALRFTVTVELFPELRNTKGKGLFARMGAPEGKMASRNPDPISKFAVLEFGSSIGRGGAARDLPERPLLRPFIEWYSTTNLSANIQMIAGK